MPHILFMPSWYPSRREPMTGTFFREQARMLMENGYQVGVLALSPTRPWRNTTDISIEVEDGLPVVRGTLPVVPLGLAAGDRALAHRFSLRFLRAYEDSFGRPDIVHAHSVFTGIYTAAAASRLWDVPYFLTEHRPSSLSRSKLGPRYRGIRKDVAGAQGRATVSSPFAQRLAQYYDTNPWDVIALPVEDTYFDTPVSQRHPNRPFTFCHVSHLDENKRVLRTVKAFATVHAQVPDTRLIIAGGTGTVLTQLRDAVHDLRLDDSVSLLGQVERQSVPGIMSQCDCFVLVSAVEAGGTVFAEAQSCGLPCIASATWAGQYMIEPDTGIVVGVDDSEALVSAMEAMIEDGSDASPRFDHGLIRTRARERFSKTSFVGATRSLYGDMG